MATVPSPHNMASRNTHRRTRLPQAGSTIHAAGPHQPTLVIKRACDTLISALSLVVLCPGGLVAALMVAMDDGFPVLYRTKRVGRDGQLFTMYKFRTMWHDAGAHGPAITGGGDPRVTRVGRLLRSSKLDEFPQLWNVLRGDMSLVGPRPEDPAYVALYTLAQRAVLRVRPGITGPAQVIFRDEARLLRPGHVHEDYVNNVMPAKLAIDLDYVACVSLWRDVRILGGTVRALLGSRSAHRAAPFQTPQIVPSNYTQS